MYYVLIKIFKYINHKMAKCNIHIGGVFFAMVMCVNVKIIISAVHLSRPTCYFSPDVRTCVCLVLIPTNHIKIS